MRPAEASALLSVRGIPSWAAILIAVVFGAAGIIAGHGAGGYTVGAVFGVIFIGGVALATLLVKRKSIFTAMVQPPIVMTALVFGTFRFLAGKGTLISATSIVSSFPIMAIATGVALLLGLVRIIAQPLGKVPAPVG